MLARVLAMILAVSVHVCLSVSVSVSVTSRRLGVLSKRMDRLICFFGVGLLSISHILCFKEI